jgi:DnaJ family protein A protein 2
MFNFNFGGDDDEGHHSSGRRSSSTPKKPVENKKFYELLEVETTATEIEKKKAYRKVAMKHHPDRGGDPETFKEVTRAYEVLTNTEKRATYDELGEEGINNEASGGGHAHSDIFDFFGMPGGGGGRRAQREKRGEDVVFPLKVDLADVFNGSSKKLRLIKSVLCTSCKGKGGKSESVTRCRACRGQGVRIVIRQIGPGMIQQMQQQCEDCNGEGSQIPEKDKCKACNGDRTTKEKKTIEVFINKGMTHGQKITFKGEADEAPDTVPGDVVVVLQVQEHSSFRREGPNLFMKKKIHLVEALTGFSFKVTHLDSRVLVIRSNPGSIVKPGDIKAIREEGMPLVKNPYARGSLYIEFDVEFPVSGSLSNEQTNMLKKALPAPPKEEGEGEKKKEHNDKKKAPVSENKDESEEGAKGKSEAGDEVEVELEDVNMEQEKTKYEEHQREAYEEEDDDHRRGHAHHAQGCRTQ